MEKEAEGEDGTNQTLDNTETVEKNEEQSPSLHPDSQDSNSHDPTEEEEDDDDDDDEEDDEHQEKSKHDSAEEEEEEEEDEERQEKRKQEYEEHMGIYRELLEQRENATQHNIQLQMKLSEYFSKKTSDDSPPEKTSYEELQVEFENCMKIQADLKQRLRSKMDQMEENLHEVENERVALSQLLSSRESRAAAASTVRSDLQIQQAIELCRDNNKLRMRISWLEEQLSIEEEQDLDPLLLQFKQLQLSRLEQERNAEKQEKYSKLQRTLISSLERLTNVKAKLDYSQREVKTKRGQLGEVEATLAEKRDILSGFKQTRKKLQRDNLRLKEQQGLLGDKDLLRDFEDTMDASDLLEKRLQHLKAQHAQIGRKVYDNSK
ncbi:unnamed protein product [Ophioblennius macclurei]